MIKFDKHGSPIWTFTTSGYREMEKAYNEHLISINEWAFYCMAYLKKLMAENKDVLEELKNV